MTDKKENDWIEWNGGECPVDPETMVLFQLSKETRREAEACGGEVAGMLDWFSSNQTPIIAYRVVSP